ncbi:DUF2252 domain-containing protein [Sagittula salina]|uniref:DUF2252 family protein n=1 Tax=Sagittula salina TaxID=2820268 RepID=A0A940MP44_9RHOB|nr:DUF2252 family protein [Sagittula salina]MBP0481572.1 DUF2252 family protein [Sagittula salina]
MAPKDSGKSANGSKQDAASCGKGPEEKKKAHDADDAAPEVELKSRVEDFRRLTERFVADPCIMRPSDMKGEARRRHVRETILEDHALRIAQQAVGARAKFERLAKSRFAFFRGTSLLFHRDMLGEDARMPTVLVLGDVHPENFGVMPNADNAPIFGVNDFDDVIYGPFTWDLKRGTTGFLLAAEEESDLSKKHRIKVARRFIEGYHEGIAFYARHGVEASQQIRQDNAPKVIRKLFEEAQTSRKDWLWDRYLAENGLGFRVNHELTPVSSRVEEFQAYIDQLAKGAGIKDVGRSGSMKVKDVCLRHGQGTASLGLARYYVLLEGPSANATDDLIVEFKRARPSALEGLVPPNDFDAGGEGDRIAHGQAVHLANGDVFYGAVEIDGASFMSRERAPFREDIDLDDLSKKGWKRYAHACGQALAQAHARSDDAGQLDYRIEPHILEAMQPLELFIDDMLCFAREAVDRLDRDHAYYRRDLELGAFTNTMKAYR